MTVYTPREDSLLLKNYLENMRLKDKKFLDMGTGSGIQALTAAEKGAEVTAVDINPEAVDYTEKRAEEKGLSVNVFCSDLFRDVEQKFDVIVFNPPYLKGEEGIGDEEIWRGGDKGLETTQKFLDQAANYLTDQGVLLTIFSSETDWEQTKEKFGLDVVDTKNLWFETLYLAVKR